MGGRKGKGKMGWCSRSDASMSVHAAHNYGVGLDFSVVVGGVV